MNRTRNEISCLLGCLLLTGCSLYQQAAQTLWCEPSCFSTRKDERCTREACCELANQVWCATASQIEGVGRSAAFEQGFKDGFADYVFAGGTGEPPPVPPRCYWNLDYRTPQGRQVVDDWFAGFRRGTAMAREGGYREQATLHSSLCSCNVGPGAAAPPSAAPSVPIDPPTPPEVIPTPAGRAQSLPILPNPEVHLIRALDPEVCPTKAMQVVPVVQASRLPSADEMAAPIKPKQTDGAQTPSTVLPEAQDARHDLLPESEELRRVRETLRPAVDMGG